MLFDRLFDLVPFLLGAGTKPFVKGFGEAIVIAVLSAGSMYWMMQSKFERIERIEQKVDARQEKIDKIDSINQSVTEIKADIKEIRGILFKPRFGEIPARDDAGRG